MSLTRTAFISAALALAAGAAYADSAPAAANQPAQVTINNAQVSIQSSSPTAAAVNTTTPTASAVNEATSTVASAAISTAPLTLQERDEFVQESSATLMNARQVAQKIDAGLKSGTLHGYERKDLEKLQNRISEADAMSLKFQHGTVDTVARDYKAAEKSKDELEEAYFPAAALFPDARRQEEARLQSQIAQLEQHKSTLQATAGAAKLTPHMKGEVKETENQLETSIKSSQKRLAQLQSAKDARWANIRHEAQENYDKTDDEYHETIERVTRPS